MVLSRTWLVEQNLAKPSRGRLSAAAYAALAKAVKDGMSFEDYDPTTGKIVKLDVAVKQPRLAVDGSEELRATKPTVSQVTAPAIVTEVKQREETFFYGIDRPKTVAQTAFPIVFTFCADCGKRTQYCAHDYPRVPKWVNNTKEFERGWLTKPTAQDILESA